MTSRRSLSIALQSNKPPAEYAELAAFVERLGFDMLSIYSDLLYQPPIVPLTLAAQATSRISLGPAAVNPFTLHPLEIAGQIAMLDQVSGGRAYLGLVRGAWLDDIGVEQDNAVPRMREAIDVIERLLRGDDRGYFGTYHRLRPGLRLRYDVRRPRVPLMVGGWGRNILALAGERADEVKIGGSANPNVVQPMRDRIKAGAERAGRNPQAIGFALGAVTVVDEDGERARDLIRREMALYLPVVAPLDPTISIEPELAARIDTLVAAGDTVAAGRLIPDDLLARFAFAGSPAEIIAQCEAIFDAGADRIEFGTPHGRTDAGGIRLLGERVLPAFRA